MQIDWQLTDSIRLLLIAVVVVVGFIARRHYLHSEPMPKTGLRRILTFIRITVFCLLLVAIASPSLIITDNVTIEPEVVIVLDDSKSMEIADSKNGSRWESGLNCVAIVDSLLTNYNDHIKISVGYGNGLNPVKEYSESIHPTSVGSDFTQLLGESSKFSDNLKCTFVISDGHSTELKSHSKYLLSPAATPVVIGVGDVVGPPDLSVENIKIPDVVYSGERVVIEGAVKGSELIDVENLVVELLSDGELIGSYFGSIKKGDSHTNFEIEYIPESIGLNILELNCRPIVNERFQSNNNVSIAVFTRSGRSKVLMLSDLPGWNNRFMNIAAEQEQRVELFSGYRVGNRWVLADTLDNWSLPVGSEQWSLWDGVIICNSDNLSSVLDVDGLQEAVNNGVGLLIIDSGSKSVNSAEIRELAGVQLVAVTKNDWFVRSDGSQQQHLLLDGILGSDGINSSWIPPLSEVTEVHLLSGVNPVLNAIGSKTLPLLVTSQNENSRCCWLGSDKLWELQFWQHSTKLENQPVQKLARNMLVWVSENEHDSSIVLSSLRSVYSAGEQIVITAVPNQPEIDLETVAIDLRDHKNNLISQFNLFWNDEILSADLPMLSPGSYSVGIAGDEDYQYCFAVSASDLELRQVKQNVAALKSAAGIYNGKYLNAEDNKFENMLADVITSMSWDNEVTASKTRYSFNSSWYFISMIILLLSMEWFIRKRIGML